MAGGGKFTNGALTAAFGYVFNELGIYVIVAMLRQCLSYINSPGPAYGPTGEALVDNVNGV